MLPHAPGAIELRRLAAARSGPRAPARRNDPAALGEHGPAEVRAVELHAPDGFVHGSQLGQRERRSHEGRGDASELEVGADPLHGVAHDLRVVERQLDLAGQSVGDGHEAGGDGVRARRDVAHLAQHREVGDGDHVHARVAPGVAVGAELRQQARAVDAGLLDELTLRGLVQRLVGPLEAAGDRPHALIRRHPAAHEQDVQPAVGHGEDDHVHRHRERRELRGVVARRHSRIGGSGHHDPYLTSKLWSCQPKLLKRRPSYNVGGRSTANGSVTSRRLVRKRNTSAGRPPAGPCARRAPVVSIAPRRRSTRLRFVAETS